MWCQIFSISSQFVTIPCSIGYFKVSTPLFDWASVIMRKILGENGKMQYLKFHYRLRHRHLFDPCRPWFQGVLAFLQLREIRLSERHHQQNRPIQLKAKYLNSAIEIDGISCKQIKIFTNYIEIEINRTTRWRWNLSFYLLLGMDFLPKRSNNIR